MQNRDYFANMNNIIKVSAGIRGKDVALRIEGKATWKIADAVKKFEELHLVDLNEAKRLIFDLSYCTAIDSTAIGLICHLAVRYMKSTGNKAVAWIEQERVWGVFELMNCDRILDMQPTPQDESSALVAVLQELKIEETGEEVLRDTMLTAHTALSELNADNEAQFAEVIEDLKKRKK